MQDSTKRKITIGFSVAAALVAVIAGTGLSGVRAQIRGGLPVVVSQGTAPYAEFQYATLTGTNNTINATRVPIVLATGTIYKDLVFDVQVSANGQVSVLSGMPIEVTSPGTQTAGFVAGTYNAPTTFFSGAGILTVSGPGVTAGGATEWSAQTAAGANTFTYPASATWYVGAPTDPNNPLAARLKNAQITSTAYSYGLLGAAQNTAPYWQVGALIGVSQQGNSITFVSFTKGGMDQATAGDQITFTLQ